MKKERRIISFSLSFYCFKTKNNTFNFTSCPNLHLMKCIHCNHLCIKKGFSGLTQRYQCKNCKKYQQKDYSYQRVWDQAEVVMRLNNEGLGVRSMSRILTIPKTTICRMIEKIGMKIRYAEQNEEQQEYELDELYTYVGNKKNECWIMYAINKATRKVIECVVGKRTTENIKRVVEKVLALKPNKIYTDFLNIYPALIPSDIHKASRYKTNRIERLNLTLRTHLKRLSRKTICFSRSAEMLEACLKIYFWSQESQTLQASPD